MAPARRIVTRLRKRIPRIPRSTSQRSVTRNEFNRAISIVNERTAIIEALQHNIQIQFQRIAQLQADLDLIKRELEKIQTRP